MQRSADEEAAPSATNMPGTANRAPAPKYGISHIFCTGRTRTAGESLGSKGSAAGGGRSDPREWQWPSCSALPVADKAEHKCVPGSIADEAAPSARKISGTPNGRQMTKPQRRQGICRTPQHKNVAPKHCIVEFLYFATVPSLLNFFCLLRKTLYL